MKKWAVRVGELYQWDEDNPPPKPPPQPINETYIIETESKIEAIRKAQEHFMKKYPNKAVTDAYADEITEDLTVENPSDRRSQLDRTKS